MSETFPLTAALPVVVLLITPLNARVRLGSAWSWSWSETIYCQRTGPVSRRSTLLISCLASGLRSGQTLSAPGGQGATPLLPLPPGSPGGRGAATDPRPHLSDETNSKSHVCSSVSAFTQRSGTFTSRGTEAQRNPGACFHIYLFL